MEERGIQAPPPPLQRLPLSTLTFDLKMHPSGLSAFRGAVVDKLGREQDLFHNHQAGEGGGLLHRYPRVQYQLHAGRAGLWGIAEGSDALRRFFGSYEGMLPLHHHPQPVDVWEFHHAQVPVGMDGRHYGYRLLDWMPLNTESLAEWDAARGLAGRAALLERILVNQLVNFLHQLGLSPEVQVEATVTEIVKDKSQPYRGVRFKALNLNFQANVLLPVGMGLGKAASEGYGRVLPL